MGELEVLYPTEKRTLSRLVIWKCKCSCGELCEVNSRDLIWGHKKSCGHLHQTVKVGEIYGNLTVLCLTKERSTEGDIICKCKCRCGKVCYINSKSMKAGLVKSCGCAKKEQAKINGRNTCVDLTNKRFGKLVAIKPLNERNGSNVKWLCKCDCGNYTKVSTGNLGCGGTKSCGCLVSYGEEKITSLLRENNIDFQKHYRVKINTKYKFFDVAVLVGGSLKYFIEYDGKQHFEIGGWNTMEKLEASKVSDKIKNDWCIKNKIPLIRIPYTHYDSICLDDLILENSNFIIKESLL